MSTFVPQPGQIWVTSKGQEVIIIDSRKAPNFSNPGNVQHLVQFYDRSRQWVNQENLTR